MKKIFNIIIIAYEKLCVGLMTGMLVGLAIFGGDFKFHLNIESTIAAIKSLF